MNNLYKDSQGKTYDTMAMAREAKANGEWKGWPLAQVAKMIRERLARQDRNARLSEDEQQLYM